MIGILVLAERKNGLGQIRVKAWDGSDDHDLDFGGKAITLRSENGPETCIIDCEGAGRGFYFHSAESGETVVDGFTIRNGSAASGAEK